jgi:hypothetical protein
LAGPVRPGRLVVAPVSTAERSWDDLARVDPSLAEWCADRWLGAWRPLLPVASVDTFAATRQAWHTLAEHVLAPWRHRATGKIGLRYTRGGFGTPFVLDGGDHVQVRVDGADLVVDRGDDDPRRVRLSDLRAALAAVGLDVGTRTGVYEPTTDGDPDGALVVDAAAAARLADWFGLAAAALEEVRAQAPDGDATRVQLWPEHFDLSVDLGEEADGWRGTFGASSGDAQHPLPYLYVTHWADEVRYDRFWNDRAFGGASLGYEELVAAGDAHAAAVAFFVRGRRALSPR